MKHPALARVFSIVLAILCLFLLANGALGFGKADTALEDSLKQYQRLEEKTDTYAELSTQLKNSVSYEEALAELEALQEQHDDDAAQHRTDLATHTATMGGYELGAGMIRDGQEQLAAAKAELEAGKKQLEASEQQLNQAAAAFNAAKPMVQGVITQLTTAANGLNAAAGGVDAMIASLQALGNPPEDPGTDAPTVPDEPVPVEKPEEPAEDAGEEAQADYQTKLAAYNEYLEKQAEYDAAKKAYEEYQGKKTAYETWAAGYGTAVAGINGQLSAMSEGVNAAAGGIGMAVSGLSAQAPELAAGLPSAELTVPTLSADNTPEQNIAALNGFKGQLLSAASVPGQLQGNLSAMEAQLAAGQQELAKGKAQLTQGEQALKKAEQELQHQLELLWYNMGQLEDESADLEADKLRLDQESEDLDRRLVSVDDKKEMEQKHRSARIVLMQEAGIASAVNAGGDLVESARAYIQNGRDGAQRHHGLLYAINALALTGGVLGLLSIPGSFEKVKRRLLLVLPTVLCLACALAADGLNMQLGLGQMYTALAAALAAVLHLATVLPKNKTPVAG